MEEIAERVWVARHEYLDVNVGVVGGSRGLLVIDTLWSEAAARDLADRLPGEVVAVVNTHDHWDHVLGNAAFGPPIHAHEHAARVIGEMDPRNESRIVVPDQVFSSVAAIDLGDRYVELLHPGRGHTAGDVVVRVVDADVLFAGDLVEQGAPPAYGEDSFPLEWPAALDLLADLIGGSTVVVPGHGTAVDQDYVASQRGDQGVVAETIRDLASRGVPLADALAAAEWPYDAEVLRHAVRLGYEHLPRSARTLPLI
ncbi:MAG TPA: MBL fold metallo-hydrolase [Nocardioidaceae bacterium]|nr:MBL fold metallo-hydrolase [Nocardioidaceae bacterium]